MAKITLQTPNSPYNCEIDTNVMAVELRDVFLGVSFVTSTGDRLSVSMRDDGFEVHYYADPNRDGPHDFNAGWVDFKTGTITPRPKE